jgi:hypothetical protein
MEVGGHKKCIEKSMDCGNKLVQSWSIKRMLSTSLDPSENCLFTN